MKKFRLVPVLLMIGLFFLPSCDDNDDGNNNGKGTLVITARDNSVANDVREIDLTDYTVTLTGAENRTMECPADGVITDLAAGEYTVRLSNLPSAYQPSFDDPRYAGTKEATVVANGSSDVEVVLQMANTGIMFEYDD